MLILHTNVYLDASADAALAARLADVVESGGDAVGLSSVVLGDLLIAASCARAGATLLTRDTADFRRISRVIPVAVEPHPI